MKTKAILFNIDHTLYNYEEVHKKALDSVLNKMQKITKKDKKLLSLLYDISKKEIHRQLAGTAASHNKELYFQRMFEHLHKTIEPKIVIDLYKDYWKIFLQNIMIDDGILDMLKRLKKIGIKIGIVTDLTAYIQLEKIEKLGISDYVDVLITSEEAGVEKPHPSTFLLAAHKLEVLAKDCIMVGDNIIKDIEGSKALGMKSIWINRDNGDDKEIIPDHTITTSQELEKLIYKLFKIKTII